MICDRQKTVWYSSKGQSTRYRSDLIRRARTYLTFVDHINDKYILDVRVFDNSILYRLLELGFYASDLFGHTGSLTELLFEIAHSQSRIGPECNTHHDSHDAGVN